MLEEKAVTEKNFPRKYKAAYLKEVYRYFACLYYIAGRIERRCMQC